MKNWDDLAPAEQMHKMLQARFETDEKDLIWLACALDSEGHIQAQVSYSVSWCNTAREFIDNVARILDKLEIPYRLNTTTSTFRTQKDCYYITTKYRENVVKILTMLSPYLVIKRKREVAAQAILDCTESLASRTDTKVTDKQLLVLIEQGLTTNEIVKKLNLNYGQVWGRLCYLERKGYIFRSNESHKTSKFSVISPIVLVKGSEVKE